MIICVPVVRFCRVVLCVLFVRECVTFVCSQRRTREM